ncbi:ubiquitin c-terminal [Lasallia pustulata]|uniref:Ubiquitin c-terminal n=1 Tax=Lasallia pustulata TaxID=136370 RepID=A0A1W5D1F8_9LECA|nr:ubiquitin c-terminal [Lasallia pustulata]
MSATPPPRPPTNGHALPQANGYARSSASNTMDSKRASWVGSQGSNGSSDGDWPTRPRYPHIKDLLVKAQAETNVNIHMPIHHLLLRAQECAKQANTNVSFKRLDRAYVEYIISSDIIQDLIPKHKDYPVLNRERAEWHRIYQSLIKQNVSQCPMFEEIHHIITEDNKRSGTNPSAVTATQSRAPEAFIRSQQVPYMNGRPMSMPEGPSINPVGSGNLTRSSSTRQTWSESRRRSRYSSPNTESNHRESRMRPEVQPKPDSLHGHTLTTNGSIGSSPAEALAERFASLRAAPGTSTISGTTQDRGNHNDQTFINLTPSTQFTSTTSAGTSFAPSQTISVLSILPSSGRLLGPRDMPPPPNVPPHPPKIRLDTRTSTSFPQVPSPAYNPARNLQTPASIPPPRSSARSMLGTGGRYAQNMSSASTPAPGTDGQSYFPSINEDISSASAEADPADLPNATAVTVIELFHRLRTYSVLLIDVRGREEFDQGHIFANSIICIEPLSLSSRMSAQELEERLVLSPEKELSLFERRNEFDLVVYYDQRTSSTRFLKDPPGQTDAPALRALHDTICDFDYYRELRRPPAVLLGGLDAWIDLVGNQSLQMSNTAALMGLTSARRSARGSGRPIGRVPIASSNSSLEVRKRRLRELNPLDAEEEKAWLEQAHNEGVDSTEYERAGSDGDTDSLRSYPDEPLSPPVRSYEDFLRRFPETSAIQQSMVSAVPLPPARAAPTLPSIPARPPPAVPRPSYSGVSDRGSSQLQPTSRQVSSAQPPLYTSKAMTSYLKLPRTGLVNFSVTCYMNATIQCLLATIPLSQFFLDNRWRDFIQKNWKGSNGIMPEMYANLIRSLWRGDVQAIRPTSLRNFCARLNREWGVDRQQDAKEFFDFLVDCLHEDLNMNWQRTPLRPLTVEQELVRERMPIHEVSKTEWERYSHRESSFISSLFAGQHASRLKCTTCRNTSTTYEAFYSISVEIPRSGRGDIHHCLRSYCQEEMLRGDEVWKCPYCKREREATKKITITRAPQTLVVHFKRFSASKTESARKVHTPIDFPLHGLDIGPYMTPPAPVANADSDLATTPPYLYDAYAVMRHLGQSGNGGHYISLVKDSARGCWRKFDDDRVTDFDPSKLKSDQRLQNEQAYLVFYVRSAAR